MKTKVWQVKMGDMKYPARHGSTKNVCARTLTEAVSKAEKAERELCAQMAEDEGEKFTPEKAIAIEFLCELDDD